MKVLRRYDLSYSGARACFTMLMEANLGPDWVDFGEEIDERLVDRVMATRPGLDRAKIREMVLALWEAED